MRIKSNTPRLPIALILNLALVFGCGGGNDGGETTPPLKATVVAAGDGYTCAVFSSGTVKCWGNNGLGKLGNGTTTSSFTPVAVTGITTAVSIAAGSGHACAVLSDGKVKCWGWNNLGQLGNETNIGTFDPNPTPMEVTGMTTAIGVAPGFLHTCAVLSAGTVQCWGYNDHGQLGNMTNVGTDNPNPTPLEVMDMNTAVAVAAGSSDSYAMLLSGEVMNWGGGTISPVAITGITNATAMDAGDYHACAVLSDGKVKCWGENSHGELGNDPTTSQLLEGTVPYSPTPVAVIGF